LGLERISYSVNFSNSKIKGLKFTNSDQAEKLNIDIRKRVIEYGELSSYMNFFDELDNFRAEFGHDPS